MMLTERASYRERGGLVPGAAWEAEPRGSK